MVYTAEIFGRRLREVREHAGLTKEAVEANLSTRGIALNADHLRNIEEGTRQITAIEFYGLSKLYGVTFEELCSSFDANIYRERVKKKETVPC